MTNQKPAISLSEDWTVVVFGFLIIGLYLLGFKIQPPSFGWSDTSDLFSKVLTINNLTNIFALFLFFLWQRPTIGSLLNIASDSAPTLNGSLYATYGLNPEFH